MRPLMIMLALLAASCGAFREPLLEDSLALWKAGRHADSLAVAGESYARFLSANDLSDAQIRAVADATSAELEETPMFLAGDTPPPMDPQDGRRGVLTAEVQRDLLDTRVTAVIRGMMVVRDMKLSAHAPALLSIVFSGQPLEPDGGVLQEASTAVRNLVAKRLALDSLRAVGRF